MAHRQVTRRSRRVIRRRRRIVLAAVATLVVIAVAATAWLAFRVLQAKNELESAVAGTSQLTAAVSRGDVTAVSVGIDELARHSAQAQSAAEDPLWRAAEVIPGIGPNLAAVRIAATQANTLAADVAGPLVTLMQSMTSDAGKAGPLLDVDALAAGRPALERATTALDSAHIELAAVDPAALLPVVADGLTKLSKVVATIRPAVTALGDASSVAPTMLGSDGPRTILVMLQNTAEVRTGGGITGTFIEVRADRGALTITAQADSSDFARRASEILPIPASTTALYGDVAGRFVQDTSITPDFDLTARLASAWWKQRTGTTVDSVISVDPLVLKAILGVTGPVTTPAGQITTDNMIDRLLVQPYLTLSQDAQTSVFQDVANAVFARLTAGGADPVALASAISGSVEEGRVSIWSAHDSEEKVLAATTLAGPAARQLAAGRQAYAVYLNDVTGGKMGTFQDVAITHGVGDCRGDDKRTVEVTVTLTNTAPANAGTAFPTNMTGGGHYGIAAGHIGTTVSVSAPNGAFFGAVTIDGELAAPITQIDAGFPVAALTVDLAPGQTKSVSFQFITAATTPISPMLLHTPLITAPSISESAVSCG